MPPRLRASAIASAGARARADLSRRAGRRPARRAVYNTWPLIDGAFVPDAARLFSSTPLWRNFFENALTVQFDHRMVAYAIWLCALAHAIDVGRARKGPACLPAPSRCWWRSRCRRRSAYGRCCRSAASRCAAASGDGDAGLDRGDRARGERQPRQPHSGARSNAAAPQSMHANSENGRSARSRGLPTAGNYRRCAAPYLARRVTSVGQRLLEVGDDVVLVLDADRQPHHVRAGAGLRPSARR